MNVGEWQKRMTETFNEDGFIGPRLLIVCAAEEAHEAFVHDTYFGHIVLLDSFQSFYYDTLMWAERAYRERTSGAGLQWYAMQLMEHASIFRSLRAAECLLRRGYPLMGVSLLRDLKDRAILLAAVASGITTLEAVQGIKAFADARAASDTVEPIHAIQRAREAERKRVFVKMVWEESGLSEATRTELKFWEKLFHFQVHGGSIDLAVNFIEWAHGREEFGLVPEPSAQSVVGYANRASEVGWLLLRLLPCLQRTAGAFGAKWDARWNVLDQSFRFISEELQREEKKVGAAFIEFIDAKFPFAPSVSAYKE